MSDEPEVKSETVPPWAPGPPSLPPACGGPGQPSCPPQPASPAYAAWRGEDRTEASEARNVPHSPFYSYNEMLAHGAANYAKGLADATQPADAPAQEGESE